METSLALAWGPRETAQTSLERDFPLETTTGALPNPKLLPFLPLIETGNGVTDYRQIRSVCTS